MNSTDFWTHLFRTRAGEAAPSDKAALALAAAHSRLYGDYLGPSTAAWSESDCVWTFSCCPHGTESHVCEAHQGFLRGTLEGLGFEGVEVKQQWRQPVCKLEIRWVCS